MSNTVVFKNLSGIEYEITHFSGKHQRLISQRDDGVDAGSLDVILSETILRVGSVKINSLSDKERIEFVKSLPSEDRKKVLFKAREFTYGDDTMTFQYNYISRRENTRGLSMSHTETIDSIQAMIQETPYAEQSNEIDTLPKLFTGTFPVSGEQYQFMLRNGHSEDTAAKDKNPSSHTLILANNPVRIQTKNKQLELLKHPVPIMITHKSLDTMHPRDIECLRKHIQSVEGRFKSSIGFPHPETGNDVVMDLLQLPAFYLPSVEI